MNLPKVPPGFGRITDGRSNLRNGNPDILSGLVENSKASPSKKFDIFLKWNGTRVVFFAFEWIPIIKNSQLMYYALLYMIACISTNMVYVHIVRDKFLLSSRSAFRNIKYVILQQCKAFYLIISHVSTLKESGDERREKPCVLKTTTTQSR